MAFKSLTVRKPAGTRKATAQVTKAPPMYTDSDEDMEQLTGSDVGALQSQDPMDDGTGEAPEDVTEHMELPKSARLRHRGMPGMSNKKLGKSR